MKRVDSGYSILIIEDNTGDYYLILEYLNGQDIAGEVYHASTFSAAKEILKSDSAIDVILLDLTLPDLSGEALISEVLKCSKNAVTIALTGYSDMDFSIRSLSMGVSDYLLKDELTRRSLGKSIRYNMERKAASGDLQKSEERYRELFESNPTPMIIYCTNDGHLLHVNRAACNQYGYNYDEFVELNVDAIRLPEHQSTFFNKEIGEGAESFGVYKKKTGDIFFAEVNSLQLEYNDNPAALEIINDVSEKLEMQERMLENTLRAEEEERNRIAKDLHDSIVQKLVACGMFTQNLKQLVEGEPELEEEVETLARLIHNISNETRDLSHNLKSAEFEMSSLSHLVSQLTRQLTKESEIKFIFNNFLDEADGLGTNLKVHVYRILQELSNNVIKHSDAKRAVVNIEMVNTTLYITFFDDGKGFDVANAEKKGIGLRNIKSRVYRLHGSISFEKNEGGIIQVHIELPAQQREQ